MPPSRRRASRSMPIIRALLSLVLSAACLFAHHPHDVVAAIAVSPNFAVDGTIICATPGSINALLISRDRGRTWAPLHLGMRGNQYKSVVFAPDYATSGTIYITSSDGGFQVSNDFGHSWGAPSALVTRSMYNIAVGPADANGAHLIATVRFRRQLFISLNRGQTFLPLAPPTNNVDIQTVAISPTFDVDQTIALSTVDQKLHISTDGGFNWTTHNMAFPVMDIEMSTDFANDGIAWLATWGQGIQIADLSGAAPVLQSAQGMTDPFVNDIDIAPSFGQGTPGLLYAVTKDDGLFASANSGLDWLQTPLAIEQTFQTSNHHLQCAVSPNFAADGTIIVGTFEGLFVCENYGATWIEALLNPTRSGRQVVVSPTFDVDRTVFAGGYGQCILRSTTASPSWEVLGIDFDAISSYEITASPVLATDGVVLAGTKNRIMRSTDNGDTWTRVDLPTHPDQPNAHNSTHWTTRDIVFAPGYGIDNQTVYALSSMSVVYESLDAGATWGFASEGVIPTPHGRSMAISPDYKYDNTLFVTTSRLYVSTDRGRSYSETYSYRILEDGLVVPPDYGRTGEFYALVYGTGFVVLRDQGRIAVPSNAGLDGMQPTAIVLSPDFETDSTIFVATTGGGVYVSNDKGRNWSPAGLPVEIACNASSLDISPDFANDQTMYLGTWAGHVRSVDGGATWKLVTDFEVYDEVRHPFDAVGFGWDEQLLPGSMIYGVTESNQAGDYMELPFSGTGLVLRGVKGPDRGMADIRVDGASVGIVDCYSPTTQPNEILYQDLALPFGYHLLEIIVLGTANPAASDSLIGIDEAKVVFQ